MQITHIKRMLKDFHFIIKDFQFIKFALYFPDKFCRNAANNSICRNILELPHLPPQ